MFFQVSHPGLQRDLSALEKQEGALNFKFGVIYARPGQILDDELLSNTEPGPAFDRFLALLGDRVKLKGWTKYRGGLDVNRDMTGEESVYTTFEGHEIMVHVSTMLPFTEDDRQQVRCQLSRPLRPSIRPTELQGLKGQFGGLVVQRVPEMGAGGGGEVRFPPP